jgi:metallo-beta-lactamase family protein
VFEVDYLILESTYGNRLHGTTPPEEELARVINESMRRGGVLIVPSFAVGRTQELLYSIRELEERGEIPALPVYVDSPMAIEATEVFRERIRDYNLKARISELLGKHILQTRLLRFCKDREESKAINQVASRAIIISASGMAEGGRVLHHLEQRLSRPENTVLFIGYQAEGTRGRAILDGVPTVKIHGQKIAVRAKVESISGFSAHADYHEIMAWLMGFNRPPLKTFIVHGDEEAAVSLAETINSALSWEVVVPRYGEHYELP